MSRLLQRVGGLARSRSLQSSALIAMGGAAFSLGNLFLARGLDPEEYGRFALVVAIIVISGSVAPAGLDQVMLRRDIPVRPRFLGVLLLAALVTAGLFGALAARLYGLPAPELALLAATTVTAAFLRVACSALRRQGMLVTSILTDTSSDWLILAIGLSTLVGGALFAGTPGGTGWGAGAATAAYAGGLLLTTSLSWIVLARLERAAGPRTDRVSWPEVLPLFGIVVAAAVLVQAERLLIPLLLDIGDLAVFALLAALVIAPFRVMGAGIVTSLTQQVRVAETLEGRRRAVRHELTTCAVLMGLATLGICVLGPPMAHLLTGGRYELTYALMAGACVNGIAKVTQSFPRAIVVGVGTTAELHSLNRFVWLSVAGTILGALLGQRLGLVGLMAGAALGSLAATLPSVLLAQRLLRGRVVAA